MKKASVRETQNRALMEDVKSVLAHREWINATTHGTIDRTRVLGIVAAGKGAENYLPYTIPKIIRQISEMGKGADLIIGLNNGFECPPLQRLTVLPNVHVIHLYTEEKWTSTTPARSFADYQCEGGPYHLTNTDLARATHRIFVVHQRAGPHSPGKIRVLGDIYGSLVVESIQNGWIPPGILVTFDAESQFFGLQEGGIPEWESNGLMLLVSKLQASPEIDLLGARSRYAVYRKELIDGIEVHLPDFREEPPPLQRFLYAVHGRYRGYQWKPGGGTVGRTDVMISLLVVIASRYPGIRNEDVHLSILAQHAGFRGDIVTDAVSTNRVPIITDLTADEPPQPVWVQQMSRWMASVHALELHYGRHNVGAIVCTGFPWMISKDLMGFRRRFQGMEKTSLLTMRRTIGALWMAFAAFQKIKRKVSERPDLLRGPQANASW